MSVLVGGPRPSLLHRQVVRRPDERKVYLLAVIREGEAVTATLYAEAAGRRVEVVESAPALSVARVGRNTMVELADGTEWAFVPGGCACGSPLKHFSPLTVRRVGT